MHVGTHRLPRHESPGGHALPHAPQLRTSLAVSLQPVAQQDWLGAQDGPPLQPVFVWQTPITHAAPGAHRTPQLPQLFGSREVLTSQPSE